MKKEELEFITNTTYTLKEKIISVEDLMPFVKDRTLLYGYTCDRKTFHVYLKDMQIHAVTYNISYNDNTPKPMGMSEIIINNNADYVPNKRLYPETCDYSFCMLLKKKGVNLRFATYNQERPIADFYGFIIEDEGK